VLDFFVFSICPWFRKNNAAIFPKAGDSQRLPFYNKGIHLIFQGNKMETPTFWEKVLRNKKRKRFRLFAFLNCDWFDFCGKL